MFKNRKKKNFSDSAASDDDCSTTIIIKHSKSKPNIRIQPMIDSDYDDISVTSTYRSPSQLSIQTTLSFEDLNSEQYQTEVTENTKEKSILKNRMVTESKSAEEEIIYQRNAKRYKSRPSNQFTIEICDTDDASDNEFFVTSAHTLANSPIGERYNISEISSEDDEQISRNSEGCSGGGLIIEQKIIIGADRMNKTHASPPHTKEKSSDLNVKIYDLRQKH